MPVGTYGSKDSPGHISLWILSLGSQEDSILQWLGKDNLSKHKSLESAVKFIRFKLMEGRSHSEARQDFDSQLTPMRWSELRHTQGESYSRHQMPTSTSSKTPYQRVAEVHKTRPAFRTNFTALTSSTTTDTEEQTRIVDDTQENDGDDLDEDVEDSDYPIYNSHDTTTAIIAEENPHHRDESLLTALNTSNPSRAAIAATFRGCCCELFVFGKCSQSKNCPNDHSSAAQERCLKSFNLLSKRELSAHSQLPPWSPTSNAPPRPDYRKGFSTSQSSGKFDSPFGKSPHPPSKPN